MNNRHSGQFYADRGGDVAGDLPGPVAPLLALQGWGTALWSPERLKGTRPGRALSAPNGGGRRRLTRWILRVRSTGSTAYASLRQNFLTVRPLIS